MRQPLPFHDKGIDFLSRGGSLLADEPGLGKTYQALMAYLEMESRHPALVTCPSSVTGVWAAELQILKPTARSLLLTSTNLDELRNPWDLIAVSMDLVGRSPEVRKALATVTYDCYIGDEAHEFGNPTAQRTQASLLSSRALAKRASRPILLTGTPTPVHVGQLWSLLTATAPDRIQGMDHRAFENRYCTFKMRKMPNGREVRVVSGNNARATTELLDLLRMGDVPWWLRRRKEQVREQLLPVTRRVIPVSASSLRAYKSFSDTEEGRRVLKAIETGDVQHMESDKNSVSRLRRVLGEAKAAAAADYVAHVIRNERSPGIIVWAMHPVVLDIIQKELREANIDTCRIDGSTPSLHRTRIVANFQDPAGPKVFLGQIKAAGTGITLTKADRSLFVERSWVPGDNTQAEDRIDRLGQTAATLQHETMVLQGSIDGAVEAITDRRRAQWSELETSALAEG